MGLGDGQIEGRNQKRPGFFAAILREEKFTEKNARHHPIGFFCHAKFVVRNGFGRPTLGHKRLGEAETKKLIPGRSGDESLELSDA